MVHHKRSTCRACDGEDLRRFLVLGPTPLANAFLRHPDEFVDEPLFPLDVYVCEQCSLVQLLDVVDPEFLFRNYIYLTGTSDTIAQHNREYADAVVELGELGTEDLVVEVASNDGSLLKCFQAHGVRTLGVEPARNIAAVARDRGVDTVNEFFDSATARGIREAHGPASAVIGNNVLAHVDEPRDFLTGCRELLGPDGHVIIEVPYLQDLLDRLEYDTVYHEHLCYFSVNALLRLYESAGLSIVRIDRVPVHGGSLRIFAKNATEEPEHGFQVAALAQGERENGLTTVSTFERFAEQVEANRRALTELLRSLVSDGKVVAACGAPAKGNTLLNYCGIDQRLVQFTVDRSPLKVGLYTPGMHIPVFAVEELARRRPDYALILAWNFAEEIVCQQEEYRRNGGHFIIPIPEPRILS